MKTKKQDMKGAGFWGRTGKKIGTRMKKIAVGTHKVLTHGRDTKSPTIKPEGVKMLGSLTSSLTFVPRKVGKKIEQGIKGIGRMGALTFTRSGKAKKQIRQELGITNYNELKRKAAKINTKRQEYQRKRNEIQQQILKTSTGAKAGEMNPKHEKKLAILEEKLKHQDWKATRITDKWTAELGKKNRGVEGDTKFNLNVGKQIEETNSKGNLIFTENGPKMRALTISEQLKKAEEHFEDQAKKKTQETLDKVHEAKQAYDVFMKPHDDAENKITVIQTFIAEQELKKTELSETYRKAQTTDQKADTLAQITNVEEDIKEAKGQFKEAQDELKAALPALKKKEFTTARKNYEAAQQAYIKRSGKAQDLTNLASRARESISESFKRLSIPDFGIDRKITRKSKIYARANVTNKETPTESQKKDKDWIIAYWTKQKSGRPQELTRLITKGTAYLTSAGEKKQYELEKDGKTVKKDSNGNPIPMSLEDILQKNKKIPMPRKLTDLTQLTNKEFAEHLNKLEEAGQISVKEHDVLKKYHTATRIKKMIDVADITIRKKALKKSVKSLDELKQLIPNYGKGVLTDASIPKGFGVVGPSDYKALKAYEHEFNEEKQRMTLALDRIDKTTDPKVKQTLINNLYQRYMPSTIVPIKFKRNMIEDNTNSIHNKVQGNEQFTTLFSTEQFNDLKTANLKELVERFKTKEHDEILDNFKEKSNSIRFLIPDFKTVPDDGKHDDIKRFNGLAQFSARMKDLQNLRDTANTEAEIQTLKELESTLDIKLVNENGDKLTNEELKSEILDKEGVSKFGISENDIAGYKTVSIDEIMEAQISTQSEKTDVLNREFHKIPTLNLTDYVSIDADGKVDWITHDPQKQREWNQYTDSIETINLEQQYLESMTKALAEITRG